MEPDLENISYAKKPAQSTRDDLKTGYLGQDLNLNGHAKMQGEENDDIPSECRMSTVTEMIMMSAVRLPSVQRETESEEENKNEI